MSAVHMDMSDRDNDDTSKQAETPAAPDKAKKPLDAKAERAARLAAALRTNLRRRKALGAAARPEPKDRN